MEVNSKMTEITCPSCERTFIKEYHNERMRAGNWVDKETGEKYDQICEECHREGRCWRKDAD